MSFGGGAPGFKAITALVAAKDSLSGVADKDWATAAGLIVKKVLVSAGQTADTLIALRTACGDDIFETQLKSLSHHQARLLARRLDKDVPDLEVSTARAAIAYIRTRLVPAPEVIEEPAPAADPPTEDAQPEPEKTETVSEDAEAAPAPDGDEPPPSPPSTPNPYFGRKSFRTG